jgi:hypothetical protein
MWGNNSLPLFPEHSTTSKKKNDTSLHSGGFKFVSESSANISREFSAPTSHILCGTVHNQDK